MLSDKQNSLVQKISRENGFQDFSVSVREGSKKGDNYLGNIFLITVEEKQRSKQISLILKCAIKNEKVRSQMPIGECYKREVYFYDTVLPAFEKLQERHPLPHPFKAFAKIYGYSLKDGDEWLLFENITSRGFRMWNRKTAMDSEHVLTVIKEHGKLHSLSFVMKHVDPEQYETLKENLNDYFQNYSQILESWTEGIQKKFENAYKMVQGDEKATEGLKRGEEAMKSSFEEIRDEKFDLVIIHGDSWCNNMIFRYEDKNHPTKPTELCFLDWQISKVTTPVYDLCYFMLLSASKEVLNNHKRYLQQYYQILDENLKSVGCDVQSVFPHGVFEQHWNRFCKIGLYIVMGMTETLLRDEEDVQTLTDIAESGHDLMKAFVTKDGSENEQTCNRIRDVISMLVENNYL